MFLNNKLINYLYIDENGMLCYNEDTPEELKEIFNEEFKYDCDRVVGSYEEGEYASFVLGRLIDDITDCQYGPMVNNVAITLRIKDNCDALKELSVINKFDSISTFTYTDKNESIVLNSNIQKELSNIEESFDKEAYYKFVINGVVLGTQVTIVIENMVTYNYMNLIIYKDKNFQDIPNIIEQLGF